MKWSKCQVDIFNFVETQQNHLVIEACAGSGKSTVLFEVIARLAKANPRSKILFLAFNKSIESYATEKLWEYSNVKSQTFHGHGLDIIGKSFKKKPRHTTFKVFELIKSIGLGEKFGQYMHLLIKIRGLGIIEKDPEKLKELIDNNWGAMLKFGSTASDAESVTRNIESVCKMLEQLDADLGHIDFDDMCRFPVIYNLFARLPRRDIPDILLVDEVQDLNYVQREYIRLYKKVNPNLRVIAVGDKNQAIYGFRGAVGSMDKILNGLKADELPLNITYRTRENIVEWINVECESSEMVAHKTGGLVVELEGYEEDRYCQHEMLQHGVTMVVSPKNKHLIKIALKFMESDILVTLKGAKIIPAVKAAIKSTGKGISFTAFMNSLNAMKSNRKRGKKNADARDMAEAIIEIIKYFGSTSVPALLKELDSLAKRDKGKGIEITTVHAAKGRESKVVAVVDDFFKMEDGQEENLRYVAFSRAIDKLLVIKPKLPKRRKSKDLEESEPEVKDIKNRLKG